MPKALGRIDLSTQTRVSRGGDLDALRMWASLLIVLYHFANEGPLRLIRFHDVFGRGYLATDFFLMLSGFVLALAYGRSVARGMTTPVFVKKRVLRIWPGHAMILVLMAINAAWAQWSGLVAHNAGQFQWEEWLPQLFLVHAWGWPGVDGWNLPSWSLSALIVCYALFPLAWRWSLNVHQRWKILLMVAGVLAGGQALAWLVFRRPLYDLPLQFGVIRALPLFLMGMLLGRFVQIKPVNVWLARRLLWVALGVLAVSQLVGRFDTLAIVMIAICLLAAGSLPVDKPSPVVREGARLSFALFISHTFVGTLYYSGLHTLVQQVKIGLEIQWPLWFLGFPLAVAGAWCFDRYLDAPVQRWIGRQQT